jgi:hypothetical protein
VQRGLSFGVPALVDENGTEVMQRLEVTRVIFQQSA